MQSITVVVRLATGKTMDLAVPADIRADSFIQALHQALKLPGACAGFLRAEQPTALVYGKQPLCAFGIQDGSILTL